MGQTVRRGLDCHQRAGQVSFAQGEGHGQEDRPWRFEQAPGGHLSHLFSPCPILPSLSLPVFTHCFPSASFLSSFLIFLSLAIVLSLFPPEGKQHIVLHWKCQRAPFWNSEYLNLIGKLSNSFNYSVIIYGYFTSVAINYTEATEETSPPFTGPVDIITLLGQRQTILLAKLGFLLV